MTATVTGAVPGAMVEDFGAHVRTQARSALVVQPRMGIARPDRMRAGLAATRAANAATVGTLTLDSYTRVGDWSAARRSLESGGDLNGYPLVTHGPSTTRGALAGIVDAGFPVQVRHGSASPEPIVEAMLASGLHTTEGGPISYCLPYGRVPLAQSVEAWRAACRQLAQARRPGVEPHVETFGGCLMGQLCPPSLLVAISVLEAVFFVRHGLRSVSLSYAQQTDRAQDEEAIAALRRLAAEILAGYDVHVVLYAYMGVFPRSVDGAQWLLGDAARLAARTGVERLIVKTVAEAHRIPTIAENVSALELAAAAAADEPRRPAAVDADSPTYREARTLVETVLNMHEDIGRALLQAFAHGYLDVPFCLHPDNAGRSRATLDPRGLIVWSDVGAMPLRPAVGAYRDAAPRLSSDQLLKALGHVRDRYDHGPTRVGRPQSTATQSTPTQSTPTQSALTQPSTTGAPRS